MNRKKPQKLTGCGETQIDEEALFQCISDIIESGKGCGGTHANREITLMHVEVGEHITYAILNRSHTDYGKNILLTLSTTLMTMYGGSFYVKNIYWMI